MSAFRRFAFWTTLATYFLIFAGGLVRVSGAGLGCPDWPKCFGRWIPPFSMSQLPADIDPLTFNLTLAWIEWFNRFAGVVIGFLIVITAALAIVHYRKVKSILYPTLAAAVLVAVQGWQGSQVVSSELEPFIVTIHLGLALVIVSLLIYVTQRSFHLERTGSGEKPVYPAKLRLWAGLLWAGAVGQILLGTQVREAVEYVSRQFPLYSSARWMAEVGLLGDLHLILGVGMMLLTILVGVSVLQLSSRPTALVRNSVWGLIAVLIAQVATGVVLYLVGLPNVVQLFHLWLASLAVGLSLVLYMALRHEHASAVERPLHRWRVAAPIAVTTLVVVALAVLAQADRSREDLPVLYEVPAFSFESHTGEPFGREQMRGQITVVDFIFTRCKGACPTMAIEMAKLYELYAHSHLVQFVSVTVDPDHDTLAVRQQYLRDLGVTDSRWQFLRTTVDSVKWFAREGFKVSDDFPGYHSTRFMLVDAEGRIRGYYEHLDEPAMARLRQDIQALARSML